MPHDPPERKSIGLPRSIWQEIADYRFGERITTENEAVRRLVLEGLKIWRRKMKKPVASP